MSVSKATHSVATGNQETSERSRFRIAMWCFGGVVVALAVFAAIAGSLLIDHMDSLDHWASSLASRHDYEIIDKQELERVYYAAFLDRNNQLVVYCEDAERRNGGFGTASSVLDHDGNQVLAGTDSIEQPRGMFARGPGPDGDVWTIRRNTKGPLTLSLTRNMLLMKEHPNGSVSVDDSISPLVFKTHVEWPMRRSE